MASSTAMGTKAKLLEVFGEHVLGSGKEDSMAECLSLCRLYSLTPQDLYYKFEAFALSSLPEESRRNPGMNEFQALRKTLQSSTVDPTMAQTPKRNNPFGSGSNLSGSSAARPKVGLGNLFGGGQSSSYQTPSRPAQGGSSGGDAMFVDNEDHHSPSIRRGHHGSDSKPWEIKQTLNASIPAPSSSGRSNTSRVKLAQGRDPNSFPSRYMFERGGERGDALDDQLDLISNLIVETYGLSEEDISDPSIVSQESVYAVGRICPNLLHSAGKEQPKDANANPTVGLPRLQPTSAGILLESSKLQGAGQRVPIWFTKDCVIKRQPGAEEGDEVGSGAADLLGLFPGMLIGVKGRNGGGQGFGVEEVLLPPGLPLAATAPSALLASQYGADQLNGDPLDIVVASGPYTGEEDLDFNKFHSLMDNVEREQPDALILIGPFIPIHHAQLTHSDLLPVELFQKHFTTRLNRLSPTAKSRTSIILIPSVEDSISAHAAWPQPAYEKGELGLSKGVRVLPDPAFFSISGIIFGSTSVDVLRDIRSEESVVRLKKQNNNTSVGTGTGGEDVIARAVRHVLSQRSFYPIFPPPQPKSSNLSSEPLPISVPHLHLSAFASVTPDVLLFRSGTISSFAKVVDGTVVINNSCSENGQIARISIRPIEKGLLEQEVKNGDSVRESTVWERCRVDLLALSE
ncbi:unnamed protein product [Sympodiomycopsis kandeliae]